MLIFDSLTLAAVADELQNALVGGKIERVSQPDALEVVLRVYRSGVKRDLLLACGADSARVHQTWIRRDNPPAPPPFCALLRKYLDGADVTEISLPLGFGERVLRLEFLAADGAVYALVAELMGRHSNLIFVDDSGKILGAAKLISRAVSRYREVLPGISYLSPPRQKGKIDPLATPALVPDDAPEPGEESAWLTARFSGISPFLAREIVLRAAVPLSAQSLRDALYLTLSCVRTGEFAPRIWTDDFGVTLGAYPIVLRSVSPANQHARDSLSLALENAAASFALRDTFSSGRDALLTALRKAKKTREREREEVERGWSNAARAEEYQQTGELLTAYQHEIARGGSEASVTDFYSETPNVSRIIVLDPTLGPRENAEKYFKKARKARDSRENLTARQQLLSEESARLTHAERETEAATTSQQIAEIQETVAALLARSGASHAEEPGEKRQTPTFDGHKIKTIRTEEGWEILVGESATANDFLTTKVAASSDIWLHVRAATSAHGVIRTQKRPETVPPATIRHAAELVAARSAVKHSSLIPVDYTLKKYVRKPRKSAPGSVTYQNEKTIYVSGIDG